MSHPNQCRSCQNWTTIGYTPHTCFASILGGDFTRAAVKSPRSGPLRAAPKIFGHMKKARAWRKMGRRCLQDARELQADDILDAHDLERVCQAHGHHTHTGSRRHDFMQTVSPGCAQCFETCLATGTMPDSLGRGDRGVTMFPIARISLSWPQTALQRPSRSKTVQS